MMRFVKYHGCGNDFVIVDEAELARAGVGLCNHNAVESARDGDAVGGLCNNNAVAFARDDGAGAGSGVSAGENVGSKDGTGADTLAALAKRVCHRQLGVGADGLIICRREPLTMDIINSDGSVAPMCGNGVRCFARYCLEENVVPAGTEEFDVHTLAGVVRARVSCRDDFGRFTAEICMGRPDWSARAAGVADSDADENGEFIGREVSVGEPCSGQTPGVGTAGNRKVRLSSLFIGTYHTVVWLDENPWILGGPDPASADARALYGSEAVDRIGRALESHPVFTQRTNVDFAIARGGHEAEMITWERGAGLTAACGTGACAVAALGIREGRFDKGGEVRISLPYGELYIRQEADGEIFMRGPAERVFSGKLFVGGRC
jgi:diaminopimelate epimerase